MKFIAKIKDIPIGTDSSIIRKFYPTLKMNYRFTFQHKVYIKKDIILYSSKYHYCLFTGKSLFDIGQFNIDVEQEIHFHRDWFDVIKILDE